MESAGDKRTKTIAQAEQLKLKRATTDLRASNCERACPGFTLFAPPTGERKVCFIDLQGRPVHTWADAGSSWHYGYLTERATLLYNGKVTEDSDRFISRQPWKGGAVLECDWNGRVLWEMRHPDHHHDGIRLRNGNVLLLCLSCLSRDIVIGVKGGISGTGRDAILIGTEHTIVLGVGRFAKIRIDVFPDQFAAEQLAIAKGTQVCCNKQSLKSRRRLLHIMPT